MKAACIKMSVNIATFYIRAELTPRHPPRSLKHSVCDTKSSLLYSEGNVEMSVSDEQPVQHLRIISGNVTLHFTRCDAPTTTK